MPRRPNVARLIATVEEIARQNIASINTSDPKIMRVMNYLNDAGVIVFIDQTHTSVRLRVSLDVAKLMIQYPDQSI